MITWYIGARDAYCANHFMLDLAVRVDSRIQLTTDSLAAYRWATSLAFPAGSLDFAQLIKVYEGVTSSGPDSKYSQPVCCGVKVDVRRGFPDREHISTSYVERQNLTMRMSNHRFTRLTNAHSKKIQNHEAAIALQFMFYNFCRPHLSLTEGKKKRTPAMAAGVADHVWSLEEVIALLPEKPMGRVRKIGLRRIWHPRSLVIGQIVSAFLSRCATIPGPRRRAGNRKRTNGPRPRGRFQTPVAAVSESPRYR